MQPAEQVPFSDERRKDLSNWLSSLSFQKTQDIMLDTTLDETGSWLLTHETYLYWRERSYGSLLWVAVNQHS